MSQFDLKHANVATILSELLRVTYAISNFHQKDLFARYFNTRFKIWNHQCPILWWRYSMIVVVNVLQPGGRPLYLYLVIKYYIGDALVHDITRLQLPPLSLRLQFVAFLHSSPLPFIVPKLSCVLSHKDLHDEEWVTTVLF